MSKVWHANVTKGIRSQHWSENEQKFFLLNKNWFFSSAVIFSSTMSSAVGQQPAAQCVTAAYKHTTTHLDGSILRGCDHHREDWVEYDTCDWSTVPTQGISLWRTGDPLFGVSLLAYGAPMCHLLLCLVQLRLQLHYLIQNVKSKSTVVRLWSANASQKATETAFCFILKYCPVGSLDIKVHITGV